jgi:hypothetical protein
MLSCKYNPSIDFLMVTDQLPHNTPANLKVINMTLDQFSSLAGKQLDMDLSIKEPYKCCDFKPVYGIILQDEIKSYDFWGHCDLDLIFGDLRAFLKEEILKIYDKIYNLGHLSIYRNTAECNDRYKEQGSSIGSYRDVFLSDKNYAFDELNGMYRIILAQSFSQTMIKEDFADILLYINDSGWRFF